VEKELEVIFRVLVKVRSTVFSLREVSTNPVYARRLVSILEKYGLAEVYRSSRYYSIVLTEKGVEALECAKRFAEIVCGKKLEYRKTSFKEREVSLEKLPEYLADNPWLKVLAERGKT